LKLIPLFFAMIVLGASLARFSDSPLLIIPFFGVLALTSFTKLDYALYILVGFLPFSFRFIMMSGTEMQVPTEPLLAVMAIALMLRWLVMGRKGVHVKFPFRFPLMLYAASLCLSMINAGHRYSAAKGSLRAIAYMTLAVVVFNVITDKRRLKWLFVSAIMPAAVAVIWTTISLAGRLDIWMWSRAYEGLLFTSYVHYGAFVAVILLILLARFIFDKGVYDRVIWTVFLVIFAVGICFSFSRGVWVSFIASVGFMLFQKSTGEQHKKILIIGGAAVFLGFLLTLPPVSKLIVSRTMSIANLGFASNRARFLRWGAALMMFWRNPITGGGYGSFAHVYRNDPMITGAHLSQYGMGAHSKYLQVLAETGLIGFSAWMWIIVSFFRYGFRLLARCSAEKSSAQNPTWNISFYRSLVIGIMAAEMSLLIHFLVNSLIQSDIIGVPFWLLLGLLPAIGNIMEKESQQNGDLSVDRGMKL